MVLGDGIGASPTKDNQIQEGVSSQPVGTVDRGAGSFACSPQTIHHLVLATLVGDDLKKDNPKFNHQAFSSKQSFIISLLANRALGVEPQIPTARCRHRHSIKMFYAKVLFVPFWRWVKQFSCLVCIQEYLISK